MDEKAYVGYVYFGKIFKQISARAKKKIESALFAITPEKKSINPIRKTSLRNERKRDVECLGRFYPTN